MSRLVRFLIITLTLGRIKWLMRLTWLWRFIVFLGVTGWLAKMLRKAIGLDRKSDATIDSAWADALRYTPQPAAPSAPADTVPAAPPSDSEALESNPEVSEATSEVSGVASDGSTETITIHEVEIDGETESIVRIEDEAGPVETLVTGAPTEEIDLANLGSSAGETAESVVEESAPDIAMEELVVAESESIEREPEVEETIEVIESIAADEAEADVAPERPKRKRASRAKTASEETTASPVEADEELDPHPIIDPDWVRGDGSHDCPDSHPVKAKASSMIFYTPESGHYDRTIPDVCFASDRDAEAAGYRPPRR